MQQNLSPNTVLCRAVLYYSLFTCISIFTYHYNWMETLCHGHKLAYGLTEKRLGEIYKCKVKAMDSLSKIKALEQRSYFGEWQNEVAERLPGKKTASMGKCGTPATKTTENTSRRISSERKRSIEGLLGEYALESRLNEFQFTSVTSRFIQKACLEIRWFHLHLNLIKYLSSRSALECAMRSAMGHGF